MREFLFAAVGICQLLAMAASDAAGQTTPLEQVEVAYALDSGPRLSTAAGRGPIFSHVVHVPQATWLRLTFDEAVLGEPRLAARLARAARRSAQRFSAETAIAAYTAILLDEPHDDAPHG